MREGVPPARAAYIRRRRRRRWGTAAIVAPAVLGAGWVVWPHIASVTSPHAMPDTIALKHQDVQPLGHPPKAPHGVGQFSFVAEQATSDEPVAYDPCRKVPWAIRDELAPPGTEKLVDGAVRQVARATGLVFVRRGDTHNYKTIDTLTTNYGRSPVVIDWTTPGEVPSLNGASVGLGRSVYTSDWGTAQKVYLTGAVALDTHQLAKLLDRPGGAAQVRAVIMRELSHALGLDYVDDANELMNKQSLERTSFGPGDREGLAALGAGHCF